MKILNFIKKINLPILQPKKINHKKIYFNNILDYQNDTNIFNNHINSSNDKIDIHNLNTEIYDKEINHFCLFILLIFYYRNLLLNKISIYYHHNKTKKF